jgi:hypothetical protein
VQVRRLGGTPVVGAPELGGLGDRRVWCGLGGVWVSDLATAVGERLLVSSLPRLELADELGVVTLDRIRLVNR